MEVNPDNNPIKDIELEIATLRYESNTNHPDNKSIKSIAIKALKHLKVIPSYKTRIKDIVKKIEQNKKIIPIEEVKNALSLIHWIKDRHEDANFPDFIELRNALLQIVIQKEASKFITGKKINEDTAKKLLEDTEYLEVTETEITEVSDTLQSLNKIGNELYKQESLLTGQQSTELGEGVDGTVTSKTHFSPFRNALSRIKHYQIQLVLYLIEEKAFDRENPDHVRALRLLKPLFKDGLDLQMAKEDLGFEGETLDDDAKDLLFSECLQNVIENNFIGLEQINRIKQNLKNYQTIKENSLNEDRTVAIKQFHRKASPDETKVSGLIPYHPNVAGSKPASKKGVMKVAEGGVKTEKAKDYKPERRKNLFLDVSRGLSAIHRAGVIHGDLKPDNLLRNGERFLITDFGRARKITEPEIRVGDKEKNIPDERLAMRYLAPECPRTKKLSFETDVFSLGMLFSELINDEQPLNDTPSHSEAYAKIISGARPKLDIKIVQEKFGITEEKAGEFLKLTDLMLAQNPEARPTAEQVHQKLVEIFG